MSADAAIWTEGLGREYSGKWAVQDLDLRVASGELYGFLGQNGAGKTTTIRMLAGLLRPSAGALRLVGRDYSGNDRALRRLVGLVPDAPPLYDYLTGRQYVALVASLWNVDRRDRDQRCERYFDLLQLDVVADELCKGYSHGMRKKVHLAAVLTTAPQVLLLDEPTTGLDPLSTRRLKDLLREEAARGTAVLLSTHVLEIAEQICHRVGILAHGRLRAEGTAEQLRAQFGGGSLEDTFLSLADDRGGESLAKETDDGPAVG
ncbi:MAG: ABC transporter ATP-binding protein [Planctomycetes bacterium]|nr:ABC transporter ATP-binding protein [Planctomycetota bacterium]